MHLADPGKARGWSINSLFIDSLINSVSQPFPPTALRRRHVQTIRDSTSSYKIELFKILKGIEIPSVVQKLRPFY